MSGKQEKENPKPKSFLNTDCTFYATHAGNSKTTSHPWHQIVIHFPKGWKSCSCNYHQLLILTIYFNSSVSACGNSESSCNHHHHPILSFHTWSFGASLVCLTDWIQWIQHNDVNLTNFTPSKKFWVWKLKIFLSCLLKLLENFWATQKPQKCSFVNTAACLQAAEEQAGTEAGNRPATHRSSSLSLY